MHLLLFYAFVLGLIGAGPSGANERIGQAHRAGILDEASAALYQAYAVCAPELLPHQYQLVPQHPRCGTAALVRACGLQDQMSAAQREGLAKVLARPELDFSLATDSGNFLIHYDIGGRDGVDEADSDNNDIPDYIDEVAATLERAWQLEIDQLGYDPPPSDRGLGGSEAYDVYVIQLGSSGVYGLTFPESSAAAGPSYLQLDNNYTDGIYTQTRGLDALHATVAHEFYHSIHFGYYQGRDGVWWQEASATWMEDVAYPEVDDYLQYVSGFLLQPQRALNSGTARDNHIYGASVFAHFLDQRFGSDLIRSIWEELRQRGSADLSHFDRVVRQHLAGGLGEAVAEFALWNYFTGSRASVHGFYEEGEKYPLVPVRSLELEAGRAVADSGQVDHLGSTYIRLSPLLRPGGVELRLDFERGRWQRHLMLVSSDSVEIRSLDGVGDQVVGWDQYQEVVLVLTEIDQTGLGYGFWASATYEPDLTTTGVPVAFKLEQNAPNPFRPAATTHTTFRFALKAASNATSFSIFSGDGTLVHRFDLGPRAARTHAWQWDGRNQAGKLVSSGVYYYVLETERERARGSLSLIRE